MIFNNISGFGSILSGISKTLGVINKAMPLVEKAGPILDNTRKFINKFTNNNPEKSNTSYLENKKTDININLPVFFS